MPELDFPFDPSPVEGDEWQDNDGLWWLFWRGAWAQLSDGGGAGSGVPTGAVLAFGGQVAPDGFALCDGAELSRTDEADLYAVIGDTFGAGDGSTTFNTPSVVERVIAGASATLPVGTVQGADEIAITTNQMPAHTHSIVVDAVDNHGHSGSFSNGSASGSVSGTTSLKGNHNHTVAAAFSNQLKQGGGDSCMVSTGGNLTSSTRGDHTHTFSASLSGGSVSGSVSVGDGGAHAHTATIDPAGSGAPIDNRQATIYMYSIIKL